MATQHIIQFGGAAGFAYSPNAMQVNVGDTIVWQGDFTGHPLSSTAVPAGAATFTMKTGTSFIYVVQAVGQYNYRCDFHFSLNPPMIGSFTAVAAGVKIDPAAIGSLQQNMPNPVHAAASHETMIHFMLDKPELVTLSLYDSKGALVATILNGEESEGMHMVTLDVMPFASGTYTYVLSTSKGVLSKNLVILQ